ncbi:MAG: phosphopantothenoylcysteine decarboxylase [Acidobacteria bacterium]|jgi:phosphopantothenoylcysteine decarboxylase/phosphopantothenate--cysteine ligase|nr:phosphopantothenoylcysteine decarboxylase [Acidobacteriota bacterium]
MKLILGVSGSIGAYKALDILRRFQKSGHDVSVVMTRAATRFIAPLSFETFAPGRVFVEMFAPGQDPLLHIHLSKENDVLLIAPASANIIGKMANGIADDLLSTVFCAFYRRVVVAPAMNTHMLENPAVADNIARLRGRGVEIIEAAEGQLANLEIGRGRLPDAETIYRHCLNSARV